MASERQGVFEPLGDLEHQGRPADWEELRQENKQLRDLVLHLSKMILKHVAEQK